jgi:uncharacterized membrane protein
MTVLKDADRWNFIVKILLPLGLLPIFSLRRCSAIVPESALLLLSSFDSMYSVKFHYPVILLSILFICASKGLSSLCKDQNVIKSINEDKEKAAFECNKARLKKILMYICISLSAISIIRGLIRDDRALPASRQKIKSRYAFEKRRKTIYQMADLIPENASISLPLNLLNPTFPFAERWSNLSFLPDRWEVSDYVILDMKTRYFGGHKDPGLEELLTTLQESEFYELIFREEDLYIFKNLRSVDYNHFLYRSVIG